MVTNTLAYIQPGTICEFWWQNNQIALVYTLYYKNCNTEFLIHKDSLMYKHTHTHTHTQRLTQHENNQPTPLSIYSAD